MTLRELVLALLRRWWLIVLVPVVLAPLLLLRARTQPYQATVRAAVILPGDTEIPGNSERPELMVLDDVPSLIGSEVFAGAVANALNAGGQTFSTGDIHGKIAATRYSRIVTITVTGDDRAEVAAIAGGAAAVLPDIVNRYLVADPATPATVQVIDPPSDPTRSRPNQRFIFFGLLLLGAVAGAGLALLADAWSRDASASPKPMLETGG
jgi:uncharacterized protein involved in exopolysaccharide biosynthesis